MCNMHTHIHADDGERGRGDEERGRRGEEIKHHKASLYGLTHA